MTPESPGDRRGRKRWYHNPLVFMPFGYIGLVLFIIAIALLVWWIRHAIG